MSSSAARPKRPAEDFTRSLLDAHGAPTVDWSPEMPESKKARFDVRNPSTLAPDALEDDAILDADVIGGRGQNVKRNAVNIDGYESDSDNEGFDGRVEMKARREKEEKSRLEEENDMFADLKEDFKDDDAEEEGGTGERAGKGKRAVRFLDENEIEGQDKTSKAGGHVKADFRNGNNGMRLSHDQSKSRANGDIESSSESEVDDEERAILDEGVDVEVGAGGKKMHAPKLDAFNMRTETEEGRFDDQGNFVRKAQDPDAIHDSWLEGLSKKDMRKAREAADKRDAERRQREIEDDSVSSSSLLKVLILHLETGETLLEALARLGKGKDKSKRQNKNKNRKKSQDVDMHTKTEKDDPSEMKRREAVETITDAADRLLTRGQPEIYDTERELLIRQYQKESGEKWDEPDKQDPDVSAGSTRYWEFRWSDARDGGHVHGPYNGTTMIQWNDAGYFGEGVEFREKDIGDTWSRIANFV